MTSELRGVWDEQIQPPAVDADSLDALLVQLVLDGAPAERQTRILLALGDALPDHLAEEAAERGLIPPRAAANGALQGHISSVGLREQARRDEAAAETRR